MQGESESSSADAEVAASSSEPQESTLLETSLSPLVALLREKEEENKALRAKVESLQEALHQENLEKTKIGLRIKSMDSEHQQVLKIHRLELDVALAQKNAAWGQLSASAEKHRAEIQALHLKHATAVERLLQGAHLSAPSKPTLHAPRYGEPQNRTPLLPQPSEYTEQMGSQAPLPPRQGESTFRKDFRRADGAKMAHLMSMGDSVVGQPTSHPPEPSMVWRGGLDSMGHNGSAFHGSAMMHKNNTQTHPREESTRTNVQGGDPRAMYRQKIRTGDLEVYELTEPTYLINDLKSPGGRAKNQKHWPQQDDQALMPPKLNPQITQEMQSRWSGAFDEDSIQVPTRLGSSFEGTKPAVVPTMETDGEDWNEVQAEDVSVDQSATTTSHDDDDHSGPSEVSTTYGEEEMQVFDKILSDPYGDRGIYTGVVLRTTGMPHGPGRIQYPDVGRSYDGEWRHGRWYGSGKAAFSNGDTYVGMYVNDKREGPGIYKWPDGRTYDGEFKDDKRHGKGTFIWPDGSLYDGDFFNGQRDGHGIYQYADGGRYEGGWEAGKYSGVGTCVWVDGRKYHGEWKEGKCNGEGVETLPDGTIRHAGQWFNDEPFFE